MPHVLTNRRDPLRAYARAVLPREVRSPLAFAEAEIVVPEGPYKDLPFSADTMPWTRLVLTEFNNPRWQRRFGLGSVQSGKSFVFSFIPLLYHLFECGQNVIYLAPTADMAFSHFREKAMPVIESTRYKEWLPRFGAGSRGGRANAFRFGNGARLRFMGAAGSDAQRSSYTAPVVIMTELDKMDTASQWSEETDPVRQGEARSTAYGDNARIYGECTASDQHGRIYKEVTLAGSNSRVFIRCPHCLAWLFPERDHFTGWRDAETIGQAHRNAAYACQHCGSLWTEPDRRNAMSHVLLVHKGQEVTPDGQVTGDIPDTFTLGVTWNAMHSSMVSLGKIAEHEWTAENAVLTDEGARRYATQFVWALPIADEDEAKSAELTNTLLARHACDTPFDPLRVLSPTGSLPPAPLPEGVEILVGAVDVQKRWLYLTADAFDKDLTRWTLLWHVVQVVAEGTRDEPTEYDLRVALDQSRHILMDRYRCDSMWVDAGYKYEGFDTHVVRQWCLEQGDGVNALVGRSQSQQARLTGKPEDLPPGVPADIIQCRLQDDGSYLWFLDVDRLKDEIHSRLFRTPDSPGYHWLAREAANEHRTNRSIGAGSQGWIIQHYMRVKRVLEKDKQTGRTLRRWKEVGQHDLWDLAAYAFAGALVTLADRALDADAPPPSLNLSAAGSGGIRTKY